MAKEEFQADALSTAFRNVAGLPERTSGEPHDVLKPSELHRQAEPEGGYDGRGEADVTDQVQDPEVAEELQDAEELAAMHSNETRPSDAVTSPNVAGERLIEDDADATKDDAK